MMSKKWILRTLALLVIVGISIVAIVRHQHQRDQQKAAIAQAKKDKKNKDKAKNDPDKEPPDEPAPAPKMEPKATVLGPAAKEHLAEKSFISALREVFLWRSSQPENPETNRILLEKLSAISCADLSPDRRNAWQSLLQAWKSDPAKAMDPQLKAQGQQAAEILNAMFKAHGDGDIVL